LYGLNFAYKYYFSIGRRYLLGRFNGEAFTCISNSGSQNLWLPFKQDAGLKVCHPKGFSGTLPKATTHFKAQRLLAQHNLAPEPTSLISVKVSFVKCSEVVKPWNCYGIWMKRILSGTVLDILRNLEMLGVERTEEIVNVLNSFVGFAGADALTLLEYARLCHYFRVSAHEELEQIVMDLKGKLPSQFDEHPDLLTWTNIVLDENGAAKVVDCDLCEGI